MKLNKTESAILAELQKRNQQRITFESACDGIRKCRAMRSLGEKGLIKITYSASENGSYLTARIFGRLNGVKYFTTWIITGELIT